jgi:hypothetical protein
MRFPRDGSKHLEDNPHYLFLVTASLTMTDDNVYRTYAKLLKWYKKGHALWEPVLSARIQLGSVGYFDEKGRWEEVFPHITDAPAELQFTKEFGNIVESTDDRREFRSKSFENIDINLDVSLELPPSPLPFSYFPLLIR